MFRSLTLTGEQIRAARALSRIEQTELARRCGLSLETIKRLERIRGPVDANSRTLNAIAEAFESLGIHFDACDGGGVGVCWIPDGLPARSAPGLRQQGRERPMAALHRLIYHSAATPEAAQDFKGLIDDIIRSASRHNAVLDVTGVLFACRGRFLQALEGSRDAVRQIYGAISCDPRHASLCIVEDRPVTVRQFGDWNLCCGLFASDGEVLTGEPSFSEGFRPEALSPAGALGLLRVVRDLQATSPRTARQGKGRCPLAGSCLDMECVGNTV